MVSVICANALNRAVKEFNITDPGSILDKTRELVIETFSNENNSDTEINVKDGMDISLCSLNRSTKELQWSGANNPIWIFSERVLSEIKPDKQPVGKTDYPKPFTTHHIQLKGNDSIYIFTDGYADQFGGKKGKKFKYSQFKALLSEMSTQPASEQSKKIEDTLNSWKGELEQVDDILVVGIRI
jgi:serine phosphatase RsbU (regulator of sigma subunit)